MLANAGPFVNTPMLSSLEPGASRLLLGAEDLCCCLDSPHQRSVFRVRAKHNILL